MAPVPQPGDRASSTRFFGPGCPESAALAVQSGLGGSGGRPDRLWTIGGGAIIYLAGLQNIPPHLYEAAALDGASAPSRFRHITLPMLSPTLFFVFITTLIGAFQVFDVAFVLGGSRGGGGRSPVLSAEPLERGIRNGRYGYASALAVVFVAVAAVVVVVAVRVSERFVYYDGDDRGDAGSAVLPPCRPGDCGHEACHPGVCHPGRDPGSALTVVLLVIGCAVVLLPVGWMLTVGLKPDGVPAFDVPAQWLPTRYFDVGNFLRVLTGPERPFGLYILNTMIIFAGSVVGTLLSCSLADTRSRACDSGGVPLFALLILTMLIPWQALMVPQFLIFSKIGWYGRTCRSSSPRSLATPSSSSSSGSTCGPPARAG